MGFVQLVDPTTHKAIKPLGRTTPERTQAVRAIEQDLAQPSNLHVRLAEGDTLTVTPHWVVVHGKGLVVTHRDDLLWVYTKVTSRKRFGITTSRRFALCMKTRRTGKEEVAISELEAPQLMWTLQQAAPHALTGWREDLDRLPDAQLVALVDGRRAQLLGSRAA